MSITIDQVPCWIVVGGISHVVMTAGDPGTHTACGSLFWGMYPSARAKRKHNGRICAKCRAALADINLPDRSANKPSRKPEAVP